MAALNTGLALHVRIGVSTGEALVGLHGELSPRFSVQGPVMRDVAHLEAQGHHDAVHSPARACLFALERARSIER